MLVIVDYGVGNVGSIRNMLRKLGHEALVSADSATIAAADRLILPGVGAFDRGMHNLRVTGLLPILNAKVREGRTPVLGICLGAQLMTEGSEEGSEPGLGWVEGRTIRFFSRQPHPLKVPSMGWHDVDRGASSGLFEGLPDIPRFYFVHSYHFDLRREADVIGWSTYGYRFAAAFASGSVFGVQFHPEKSHRFGMRILDNFARLTAGRATDRAGAFA
jgi:glutamine amidotransferase